VPRGEIDRILESVRRAKALPQAEWPELEARDNDPPHVILLANLLGVVLTDWCTHNRLASNLVASGSDLKALVRSRVYGDPLPTVPLTRGWRAEAVLPNLNAILNGQTMIRVANPSAVAPLDYIAAAPTDERETALPGSPIDPL
jgi:ribonuclease D